MLATVRQDLRAARERDPAARSGLEVALTYAGVHAVWAHRLNHTLWTRGHHLTARLGAALTRWLTGVEIHPGAVIGPGLFIDHGMGVVIGETAEVGRDVTLYHGSTLGGTSLSHGKRHPTVGDRVTVGAGAKVLGPVTIGDGSRIGANAVVVKDVPSDSVVVGVPGQVIVRSRPRRVDGPVDLDSMQPDVLGASLQGLLQRVENLEAAASPNGGAEVERPGRPPVAAGAAPSPQPVPSAAGTWAGDDFSI